MSAEAFFVQLHDSYTDKVDYLNALDAAVGDGDHGATMLRGLSAAIAADKGRRAKAFMRASGGASGTLFGLILIGIETHLERFPDQSSNSESAHSDGLNEERRNYLLSNLTKAHERICDLGEVQPGDKSMVDALAPALSALQTDGLDSAVKAAAAGRDATREMVARRGRAQYVEAGGKGHIDPGAVSVVMFLETLAAMRAV